MQEKICVYAGSFDPITNGHLWMIECGAKMFDRLIVAIGVNPDKKCMFTADQRVRMVKGAVRHLENVEVANLEDQFLVTYAKTIGAQFMLRGIRSVSDYEYERVMRHLNSDIDSEISTVFLMPPREIAEVSSSIVRSLVGPTGWEEIVRNYVPEAVHQKLVEVYRERRSAEVLAPAL